MKKIYTKSTLLLSLLLIACGVSFYTYTLANQKFPTIFHSKSVFYTPGREDNCKWVIHISERVTTAAGDTSHIQIGIPEISEEGYIPGIIQSGPGNSIILAFKLPTKSNKIPPVILTATYEPEDLPISSMRFRISNSTTLTMVIYNSYEKCLEAIME
jgi:hypothetical protein